MYSSSSFTSVPPLVASNLSSFSDLGLRRIELILQIDDALILTEGPTLLCRAKTDTPPTLGGGDDDVVGNADVGSFIATTARRPPKFF